MEASINKWKHSAANAREGLLPSRWMEVALLVLFLGLWFGYELGSRALWSPDEGRYAEIPREMVASGDYLTPRLNGIKYFEKPPLVYWLESGAIQAFGVNEWALRIWPALFALIGCLALYYTGSMLYSRRAGMYAAGILAMSPLYDFMGGILTLDMPLTTELTVALCAFLLGTRTPLGTRRRFLFYLFYATTALAVLTKGLVGMVIPAMVIGAWILVLSEWRLLREMYLPSGLLLFLAIAVPWHVLVWRANPEFGQFYFVHEHFERYLTTVHQRYEPMWFFLPVLLVGMYPWTVFLPYALSDGWRELWRERRRHADIWFMLFWAVLPFLFFSFSDSKLVPYILPVFPPLALLLGRWLAIRWEHGIPLIRAAFVTLLVLGIVLSTVLLLAPALLANNPSVMRIVSQLGSGRHFMAAGLLLAGVVPFVAWWRAAPRLTLAALFAGGLVLVAAFDLNFSRLDVGRSVKDLALVINDRIKPGDDVVTYDDYYQDLPVYLGRRVTVVNWKGELEFGTTVENTSQWMIDDAEFRRRWNGPTTLYVVTNHLNYERLRANPPGPMQLLAQTRYAVLLTNRETRS